MMKSGSFSHFLPFIYFLSSDPAMRSHIPRIFSLLESGADASELFRCVPSDVSAASLVRSFLRRHIALQRNANEWQRLRYLLDESALKRAASELAARATRTKFSVDERAACSVCERQLRAEEEFVRYPHSGQLSHLRCYELKKV